MPVCKTDALAVWRSERSAQGCYGGFAKTKLVHPEGLEPPRRDGRPLLRRLRLPFPHECVACFGAGWGMGDLNLPPLAYATSALPDVLSQAILLPKNGRGAAPGVEATSEGAPRLGAASEIYIHNVKRARRRRRRSP